MFHNLDYKINEYNTLISVVVPVYNEEETIGEVLSSLMHLKKLIPMEIIVVDDGSKDNTLNIIRKYSSIYLIQHKKNEGKGSALKTGISKCNGNIIVIQDADLEYFPKDIQKLVDPILYGKADVVFGSRFLGYIEGMSFLHILGNRILSFVSQLLYKNKLTDIMTGYKAFSSDVIKTLDIKEKGFAIEIEITSKILNSNFNIIEVPISYAYRKKGKSKITFIDGIRCLIKLISFYLNK